MTFVAAHFFSPLIPNEPGRFFFGFNLSPSAMVRVAERGLRQSVGHVANLQFCAQSKRGTVRTPNSAFRNSRKVSHPGREPARAGARFDSVDLKSLNIMVLAFSGNLILLLCWYGIACAYLSWCNERSSERKPSKKRFQEKKKCKRIKRVSLLSNC